MRRTIALVVLAVTLLASVLVTNASANTGFGTRNITIKTAEVKNCDGVLCDSRVTGLITVRNFGTKDLVVDCPLTVHFDSHGPVAHGTAHLLIYPNNTNTVAWTATGVDSMKQKWNKKGDISKYWVERGTVGTLQAQVVSCIESI